MRASVSVSHIGKPDVAPPVPEPTPTPAKPVKTKQTEADVVGAATPKE